MPRIREGTKKKKEFAKNSSSTENCVSKNEKDFTLKVPINPQSSPPYVNGNKNDVYNNRLFYQTYKLSKKVMVLACVTQNSVTKPFFVNDKGLKGNSKHTKAFRKRTSN